MYRAYDALLPLARAAARLLAPLRPKLREGLAGRRGALERIEALGREIGGRAVWIHTTSVGEYEQARPLDALLREHHPGVEILHTFFSPSGYNYARKLGEARHIEYLPEDTRAAAARVLSALRPRVLVFMKFDLWPNLVREAHRRGVPVMLFDATLRPGSWRSRWPARSLYSQVYRRLEIIDAVTEKDAARFRALVPDHPGLVVDGDTRFDQVVSRSRAARRTDIAPALLLEPRPFTLVAGSTWGPDEARLVPAWRDLLRASRTGPVPRLVLVPHEPTSEHLEALEARLREAGLASRRYSDLAAATPPPVLLVDQVGILAELYEHGDAAYVGGAFGSGVHNLMEPAIFGLPLLFGPGHRNAPEAQALLDAGAAAVIRSPADLLLQLEALSGRPQERRATGAKARAFVEANLGASERCLARLAPHLTEPAARSEEHSR